MKSLTLNCCYLFPPNHEAAQQKKIILSIFSQSTQNYLTLYHYFFNRFSLDKKTSTLTQAEANQHTF